MASHIIGISGRKRSGKDTFASRLVEAHGFTRIAFADPLKATMLDLDPLIPIEADETGILYGSAAALVAGMPSPIRLQGIIAAIGWEKAKELREVRRLLQAHGVAIREHVGENIWVNAALWAAHDVPGPVVITDVRFPNEVDGVRMEGGKIVRIYRPGLPEGDLHISETALDDLVPDFAVTNDDTVGTLYAEADYVAEVVLS